VKELTNDFQCSILFLNLYIERWPAPQWGRFDNVTTARREEPKSIADLVRSEDDSLLPINLLDGPTPAEMLLSSNLRHEWRGFSFGNFWFGYYLGVNQPSPLVEERWAV
jgi:hypothetical protein